MIRRIGWIAFPLGENMLQINLWSIYVLGHSVSDMHTPVSGKPSTVDLIMKCTHARDAVNELCRNNVLQLSKTTFKAAEALRVQLDKCYAWHMLDRVLSATDLDGMHSDYYTVMGLAQDFETAFAHECQELNTFFVPQKGTHQTALLMKSAVNNLSADIRSRLSKDAITDINAAGKCLALEVPTASGFYILRAVEALMRDYYFKLTSTPLPVKSRNWGAFIKALDKHGADSKVTGFLTHIKDFYRNPIVHPEEVLSIDEAFSLFHASLSAITMLDAAINVP